MAEGLRSQFWATPLARKATILLLILQLAGCAVDLTIVGQESLESVFCLASAVDNHALEWTGGIIWLTLAFSWVVGAVALRIGNLRPVYWMLILAIPLALIVQESLLRSEILYCDGP